MKQTAASIYLDDKVKDYVLDIVSATRHPENYQAQRIEGRSSSTGPRRGRRSTFAWRRVPMRSWSDAPMSRPRTSRTWRPTSLRHRVLLTYEAEAEETTSDDVIRKVLESVPVP